MSYRPGFKHTRSPSGEVRCGHVDELILDPTCRINSHKMTVRTTQEKAESHELSSLPGFEESLTRSRSDVAREHAYANFRTQLNRIIRKAGLEPWPKRFHNLPATRETELNDQFPGDVVCKWIGNSEGLAKEHYLRTTDKPFERRLNFPAQVIL